MERIEPFPLPPNTRPTTSSFADQSADWNEQDQSAESVLLAAEKLLAEAGTLDLAHKALETAARREH